MFSRSTQKTLTDSKTAQAKKALVPANPRYAAAILSMLPQPMQAAPGDSFNDRILLLLSAVANSEGILTYRAYQLVQEAALAIFGERALHAEVQAKLHHALLYPPANAPEIARSMAHQAEAQKVSASFVNAMLAALASISSHAERIDEHAQALVRDIDWAFRKSCLERDESWRFGLGINVGESLTGLYRFATRALPSRLMPGRKLLVDGFTPETSVFNAGMETAIASLERIAWTLDDKVLQDELHMFKKTLRAQPFKIVVVGERKRGKSSLINAIIGQKLSPIRESTPETATVLEFHYSVAPDYTVRFLDEAQFAWLEDYLAGEEGNLLLTRKVEEIRKGVANGTFMPGKLLSGISSWDDLDDYVSLDGRFSGFVARVSVGLPLEMLRAGVALIDTPGLNDTDQFHDYLAFEESLEADCLLFVMDARNPGSHSELSLLRRLARSGRTVRIIGVLTSIDKLNDAGSLEQAREQARIVLLEACRGSEHVHLAGLVALNARKAMDERCGDEGSLLEAMHLNWDTSEKNPAGEQSDELEPLLHLLREVMELDSGKTEYRRKIAETYSRIVRVTREHIRHYMEAYRASLPGTELLAMLDAHARDLSEAALRSLEQARQVVNAAGQDLDAWDRETTNALTRFQETLTLRLMDGINRKVAELGRNFARDSEWKAFDSGEARAISRKAVDEFLEEQRNVLQAWQDKLRLFSANMEIFSQDCLTKLSASLAGLPEGRDDAPQEEGKSGTGLENRISASNTATHFLVQTHRHMKNLAVFSSGVGLGRASAFAPITLLVTAGNILALAASSPVAAAVFAAVAGTAGFIYHLGREDRRKAAFLEKKRRETEAHAARVAETLAAELATARADVGKAYEFEVRRGFAPALESLFQQSMHLRLFLDVMNKIRADTDRYEAHVQHELQSLRRLPFNNTEHEDRAADI